MMKGIFRAAVVFFLLFAAPLPNFRAQENLGEAVETSNILVGRIFQDGEMAQSSATVRAYHLGSGQVFSAITSPESGSYILTGLPDGSFEISIEIDQGIYYAPELVNLSGGMRALGTFSLQPGELPSDLVERLTQRNLDLESALGIAKMDTQHQGKPFWTTGPGIATIVLGAIVGVVILDEVLEDDDGSPSGP